MRKKLIGMCPVCEEKLMITELKCKSCGTKIQGEFTLGKFDNLTQSQQEFALIFIKNAGNIKLIEKELNISYPTVKKNLEEVITALGFDTIKKGSNVKLTREEIYSALRNKEIGFDEAEAYLLEVDEND